MGSDIRLPVIPKPAEGTRVVLEGDAKPLAKGTGPLNYLCGNCGETLLEGIEKGEVTNIVLRCPYCGSYNDLA